MISASLQRCIFIGWLAGALAGTARADDASHINVPFCTAADLRAALSAQCLASAPRSFDGAVPVGAEAFPTAWRQLGFDQGHNPVFPVPANAPDYLARGAFWAAPLTGDAFLRVARALKYYGDPQSWAVTAAQYLGNVMGVSVARGVVYAPLGRNVLYALSAADGRPLWRRELINAGGMGQVILEEVQGRFMAFVPTGDAAFTFDNALEGAAGRPHARGANFASLYALDALTGDERWRFDAKGSLRTAPLYRDGRLYVSSADGHLHVLDAATGSVLSSFTNPGSGLVGLASANWHETADGRLFIVYGTIRPPRLVAVDVTDPAAPRLAWEYAPPGAAANAPGDVPVAIDAVSGLVLTNVFTNVGTPAAPVFDTQVLALNASTGALVWRAFAGRGPNLPGFKGSVPLVHGDTLYMANPLNGTYRAYDIATGGLRWVTDLARPTDRQPHTPRAAGVYFEGRILLAEGRSLYTFDAASGAILNRLDTPGLFAVWGINQPAIVGRLFILSSISGWVFAAPVDFIMSASNAGVEPLPLERVRTFPQPPEFFNPAALPAPNEAVDFPRTWLAYAGGPEHNAVVARGPRGVSWRAPLNDALSLEAPPRDQDIFDPETAAHMTHLAFGVGTGVTPARGMLYAGGGRQTISAFNALNGELIWRFRTQNANFSQPLVTERMVIVSAGDPWLDLGSTFRLAARDPATNLGDRFQHLHGLDSRTGVEKWTFYTTGTNAPTPLHYNGKLHWLNGDGALWAIDADSGRPAAPFMDAEGFPRLKLGGFNAVAPANFYRAADGRAVMLTGTAVPGVLYGIDLDNAEILWTQRLDGHALHVTGFAAVATAVDARRGLAIGAVLIDADAASKTADLLAFALDARTGGVAWTRRLGRGPLPYGLVAPTPFMADGRVYFSNPMQATVDALDARDGTLAWRALLPLAPGRPGWAPGAATGRDVIVAAGDSLYTLDARSGALRRQTRIGGAFIYNHPTIVGDTLYVGNSWGWATAWPVASLR